MGGGGAASLGSDPSWSFQADAYGHIPRPPPRRWLRTHSSILTITPTVATMGLWLGAYVSVIFFLAVLVNIDVSRPPIGLPTSIAIMRT